MSKEMKAIGCGTSGFAPVRLPATNGSDYHRAGLFEACHALHVFVRTSRSPEDIWMH